MNAKFNGSTVLQRIGMAVVAMGLAGLLAACGGGNDSPPAAAPLAVAITAQPTDQSAVAGTAATFSVTATNATGYQWQRSTDGGATFGDISGATVAAYTTPASTLADSGAQYRVVVAGSANSVTSSAAQLTVTATAVAPSITMQPAAQTITAGQNASYSVTAAGSALTYQWQHSMDGGTIFTDEPGATAATLTLSAVAQSHNGHFLRVVVRNSSGSVTSTAALLTVNSATAAAAFTQHPASQSVTAPAAATFNAAASGTPAPTLQWQVNAGPGWDDIIGATSASYTTPATALSDNGKRYRVMATNVSASGTALVTSNAATLTVGAATMPSFTTQPASVTITAGQSTQFTAAASGTPTPGLQWQLSTDNGSSWNNTNGATSNTFDVINAAQANNGRQFRAVASNSAGVVNSNAALLTVTAASVLTIQTATALPPGVPNVAYGTTLSAVGGTSPYFWSSPAASVLQTYGLSLNPTTGQLSGTPNAAVAISFFVDVSDGSPTPQSAQKEFVLRIDAPCNFGSLTVAGAPPTVEGKLCPQRTIPPDPANPANGLTNAAWLDENPAASIYKGVGVGFNPATGEIASVSFNLRDPTRSLTYLCAPNAAPNYPPCSGVTVNTASGTVTFVDTLVGSGTAQPFTLNGVLRY